MKKKIWLGMLAMMLVFGMMAVGCADPHTPCNTCNGARICSTCNGRGSFGTHNLMANPPTFMSGCHACGGSGNTGDGSFRAGDGNCRGCGGTGSR